MDKDINNQELKTDQKYQHLVEKSLQGVVIIQNLRIIYSNPAFSSITGYSISELLDLKANEFINLVHPDDKKMVYRNFRKRMSGFDIPPHYKFKGMTKDGKIKVLDLHASLIDYEGKPALMGIVLDVTDQLEAEEKLKHRNKLIETILNNISLGIAVSETDTGKYSFINQEVNNIFGLGSSELPDLNKILSKAKTISANENTLQHTINSLSDKDELKDLKWDNIEFTTKKGEKKYISAKKILLPEQKLTIFTIQDITERLKAEKSLKDSIKEKEILLREIHHRVKNNLQTISSLLDLQAESLSDPKSLEAFRSSQSRIRSMALIHERLYKAQDLAQIRAIEYVENLIDYLEGTYHSPSWNLEISTEIEDLYLNLDVAIPCGLIINELVSNSIKYAFPIDQNGSIMVSLKSAEPDNLVLIIKDNGIGIPLAMRTLNTQSLGLELVQLLVKQLNGKIEIDGTSGTQVKIIFPKPFFSENINK